MIFFLDCKFLLIKIGLAQNKTDNSIRNLSQHIHWFSFSLFSSFLRILMLFKNKVASSQILWKLTTIYLFWHFSWNIVHKDSTGVTLVLFWWSASAVNYYHKALHLGYCSSPRSASDHITVLKIDGEILFPCIFSKRSAQKEIWTYYPRIHGSRYSRIYQVNIVEDSF